MSFEVRVDGATLLTADAVPDHINAPTVLAPITIAQEIGERPTASLNAWWPSAAGLSELVLGLGGEDVLGLGGDDVLGIGRAGIPEDYSEVTIDSPGLYYRAAALSLSPIAYWPLDESPSVQARDVSGNGQAPRLRRCRPADGGLAGDQRGGRGDPARRGARCSWVTPTLGSPV